MKFVKTTQLFLLYLIIVKTFSLFAYFKFDIFYVDDYIDCIVSSEGIIYPINPHKSGKSEREESYTFQFNYIKHNLKNPLCIRLVILITYGYFYFKNAFVNEYDITVINYKNYYYCNDCYMNKAKIFEITKEKKMVLLKFTYQSMMMEEE